MASAKSLGILLPLHFVVGVLGVWEISKRVGESAFLPGERTFVRVCVLLVMGAFMIGLNGALWGALCKANGWKFWAGGRQPRGIYAVYNSLALLAALSALVFLVHFPRLADDGGLPSRCVGLLAGGIALVAAQFAVYGAESGVFRGIRRTLTRDETMQTAWRESAVLAVYAFLTVVPFVLVFRSVFDPLFGVGRVLVISIAAVLFVWAVGSAFLVVTGDPKRHSGRYMADMRGLVVGIALGGALSTAMFL